MAVYPPNLNSWTVRTVTVVSAGTPVRGPNVRVPNGMELAVRLRTPGETGYIGPSAAAVLDSGLRTEVEQGEGVGVKVVNMDRVWFDATDGGVVFELVVEQ